MELKRGQKMGLKNGAQMEITWRLHEDYMEIIVWRLDGDYKEIPRDYNLITKRFLMKLEP